MSGADGVSVARLVAGENSTTAGTATAPGARVSVRVDAVIVVAFIASLNVTVIVEASGTLVAPLPGVTAVTVGADSSTGADVTNCVVATDASPLPARSVAAVVTRAVYDVDAASGALGVAGRYFADIFAPFEFAGIEERAPTRTFSGQLDLKVGDRDVSLIEVGPAHTAGDVLVHVPDARTVFTGDILFIEGTPIMWAGPVGNWIKACERILAMDVDTIVPGHGPLTDKAGVRAVADYLEHINREARARYDAGLDAETAARDIAASGGLGRFASWSDAERIVVNVDTLYREFSGDKTPPDAMALFDRMGRFYYDRRG